MSTPDDSMTTWAQAATDAFVAAAEGRDPLQYLRGLDGAPAVVWRAVVLEWVAIARDITRTAAELSGMQFHGAQIVPLDGDLSDYSPPQLAAMRTLSAGLSGDDADAATVFTAAWNTGTGEDAGHLVQYVLMFAAQITTGGGSMVNVRNVPPPAVTVPDDASALEGPRG